MLSQAPFEVPAGILERARALGPAVTAVANAGARLPMESARMAVDAGVMTPVLVGDRDAISREADEMDWDISRFEIVSEPDEADAAATAARLCGEGHAQALMKGHLHTDAFMLAVLEKSAGLRTGRRFTHVFHMTIPGREGALVISDAAINVAPDMKTRQASLLNAVDFCQALGTEVPKVAIISATEDVTHRIPSSLEADELSRWARDNVPGAEVYGPLALDNAISREAARVKGIDHPVAGNADIVLVPEIVSGNALFKMMVYMCSACAAGLVLGASVPIVLTSRADPPVARLASIAIANILTSARQEAV